MDYLTGPSFVFVLCCVCSVEFVAMVPLCVRSFICSACSFPRLFDWSLFVSVSQSVELVDLFSLLVCSVVCLCIEILNLGPKGILPYRNSEFGPQRAFCLIEKSCIWPPKMHFAL